MSDFKLFAVTGHPVLHSRSPQMHNAGFDALGINARYVRLAASSAQEAVEIAKQIGISGMNVTAPFKEDAFALAGRLDDDAKSTGAVNTLLIPRSGKPRGFNTDVEAVKRALEGSGVGIPGSRAVVVGAGGAARAAVVALAEGGAEVTIANRTVGKAREMAAKLGCSYCGLGKIGMGNALSSADILVSAVSTSGRVVPPAMLRRGMAVLDAYYAKKTALLEDAARRGCRVIGPQEWLLCQGFAAFELFSGRKAPREAMRRAVAATFARKRGEKANVALVGLMGSGKTTVAKKISDLSGLRAVETDGMVESEAGMGISEIFERYGEARFRRLEKGAVAKACRMKRCVLSCGGGAVLDPQNVAMLRKNCVVAWLWATPEENARRTQGDSARPLFKVKNRLEVARRILDARKPIYAAACDIVVGTQGQKPSVVAGLICDEIGISR